MAEKVKHIPLRKCVGCQQMLPKDSLIRLVKSENGIIIDSSGKLDGRGAYLCGSEKCLKHAIKAKRLEKVFHTQISADIYGKLEELSVNLEVR